MSQEPPNSQSPLSSEPGGGKSETNTEKVIQTPQTTTNRTQPVLKTQLINFLRRTIRVLEGVVEKLEKPSTTTEPSFFDKLQVGWSATLAKIRSLLPENLSSKLSDAGLTAIIAGIIVVLVGTTSVLSRSKPTEVATVPASKPEQPVTITPSPAEPEQPTIITPTSPPPEPEQPVTITPPPTASPELIAPPELTAPAEPKPVEITPPPEPVLTPEQNLIAAIENQVAELTESYADGLIQSIQVNFEGRRLTIKVGDDWYTFNQSQQDKLATRMFERAKQLDFTHLEITDPQGTLIARSPVVGNNMVILKR